MSRKQELSQTGGNDLFDRVATIRDQARSNVVRSVNTNMVLAYWLIGREIVQELQGGEGRAEYLQFLPSEQELIKEIERERTLIEAAIEEADTEKRIDQEPSV